MKKITVNASKKYDIIIESGALSRVGEYAKSIGLSGKACVVSDSCVAPLYLEKVAASLENAGFEQVITAFAGCMISLHSGRNALGIHFLEK